MSLLRISFCARSREVCARWPVFVYHRGGEVQRARGGGSRRLEYNVLRAEGISNYYYNLYYAYIVIMIIFGKALRLLNVCGPCDVSHPYANLLYGGRADDEPRRHGRQALRIIRPCSVMFYRVKFPNAEFWNFEIRKSRILQKPSSSRYIIILIITNL